MPLLALNTGSFFTKIALFDGKFSLISEKKWKSNSDESEKLLPEINKMLQKTKSSFEKINSVFALRGPGSFTGLRVGVSLANAVSYINKCKLFSVNNFEYFWKGFEMEHKGKSALLIYAGSGGVYISVSKNKTGILYDLKSAKKFLKAKKIKNIFGEISDEQKKHFKNFKFLEIKSSFGKIVENILKNKEFTEAAEKHRILAPLYIKEPSITKPKCCL